MYDHRHHHLRHLLQVRTVVLNPKSKAYHNWTRGANGLSITAEKTLSYFNDSYAGNLKINSFKDYLSISTEVDKSENFKLLFASIWIDFQTRILFYQTHITLFNSHAF